MNNLNDTIAAISTPIGEGGIGIIRLSGKKSFSIADKIFISKRGIKPSLAKTHTMFYGHIVNREKAEDRGLIDEVLLTVMRAPATYTKEDIIEINCHGGIVALRKIMEEVLHLGARLAEPGEFTKRAFLNGRIDLAQAEAVCDVVKAKTESSLKVAIGQLEGGLSQEIRAEREKLLEMLRDIEVQIDFQEEDLGALNTKDIVPDIEKIISKLKEILDTQKFGIILKEGLLCVICGKPNTGKSSLMNALTRRNRSIVTHIPGTTRDAIEEVISVNGIPLRIVDTAGLVNTGNIVEKKGVEKTRYYLQKADIIIFMLDLSKPFGKKDKDIIKKIALVKTVVLANKCDLKYKMNPEAVKEKIGCDILEVSVLKRINLSAVEKTIEKKILGGEIMHPEAAFLTNIRHKNELKIALRYLNSAYRAAGSKSPWEVIALDVKNAIFHLGLIIGESVDIDVLDRIFEKFCIGK